MMKEIKPLEAVKSKIWMMFDTLRVEQSITSDFDYHLVLFLLSAYKDNLISIDLLNENQRLKERLIEQLRNSNNEFYEQYAPIIQSFEPSIQKLSENGLKHLFSVLIEINKQVLTENFPNIFDSVLYRISQSQGRYSGEFIQPVELTRFMCGLADLKKDTKVFNPFAGSASFGVYLPQGYNYFGQELNHKTWALGTLRLMAYSRLDQSNYICDDSILHWPDPTEKFDLIISNPPFGIRLGNQYNGEKSSYRNVEHLLIDKGLQSLNEEGKLVVLLPKSFLFRGMSEQSLREYLVQEDLIDTIIELPSGILSNIGISLNIVVLSKRKKTPGKVRFVDARKFIITKDSRDKVLNDKKLLDYLVGTQNNDIYKIQNLVNEPTIEYNSKENDDTDIERLVDIKQIKEYDYNLNVDRYFQKEIEGVRLSELLELIRGKRGSLPKTGKLIRIRDLKDDKVEFNLEISAIEETELKRKDIHLVSESCLLLAMRWRTLKPTLFEFKGESVYRNQDILSFKINESLVDKAYLINELNSEYVIEQLQSYQLDTSVVPYIRKIDLMKIVVKLPSLEEQRAKLQGVFETTNKIDNYLSNLIFNNFNENKFIDKSLFENNKFENINNNNNILNYRIKEWLNKNINNNRSSLAISEFASLKHTLGRPRQNILDWSDNLLDFLNKEKEGFEALNKAFSEFYEIDIISALKEIKRDVNFITDVLEKGENGLVLSEYKKQVIPLFDINSSINELSNNGFNFKIKKLLLKGEKLKERGIYANKTLFKTLLDNILTNAQKYAFDKNATGNEVIIELTEIDDSLSMEIRNNGKPFPKNFDREKFITKYSTADSSNGSGLGGYDIHRIACDFNNPDWMLLLNEDPFFLVKFKFQFPIKLIN